MPHPSRHRVQRVNRTPLDGLGTPTRAEALAQLGNTMYAVLIVRTGAIKFGWTSNLYQRLASVRSICGSPVKLLAVMPGASRREELDLHASLSDDLRSRGREYYLPAPEILAIVNEWRAHNRLRPLAT